MPTATKEKTINIPINGLTWVGTNEKNGRAICEVDIGALRQINEAEIIDILLHDARADYQAGNYKTAHSADELISELRGEYGN